MSSDHSNHHHVALVDCNNFYVSCERIFNPKLWNKPVIVLSSNDGCVVARSNESKLLGIQMGQPFFQIEKICRKNGVFVFSSNFALYGDISHRVMKVISDFCLDMEIYSIDEAFLRLEKLPVNAVDYAIKIKKAIWQKIGIPVSVGIAPTHTLAKIAGDFAKKQEGIGVYDLRSTQLRDVILQHFPVESVWGVGKNFARRLHYSKIHTAAQLCQLPSAYIRKEYGVMMSRVVSELQGVSCISLASTMEDHHSTKNIMCSRSFGRRVTALSDVIESISTHCATACRKARMQKMKAQAIAVYIRTGLFDEKKPVYSASEQQVLILPSNDTLVMTDIAIMLLKKIFKSGYDYKKAGVMLLNLQPAHIQQNDFFELKNNGNDNTLMNTLDAIQDRFGSKGLFLASEGMQKTWQVKTALRSPRYTTQWDELALVR